MDGGIQGTELIKVERAADISAQVFTARDAMLRDTLEDSRVAYLLFDSAIETLMVRRIHQLSRWVLLDEIPSYVNVDRHVVADLCDFDQKQREKLKHDDGVVYWKFSKTQLSGIGRNFDEKLRVLAWNGDIPREYVGIVSRLHEYRNEMYHREESRPAALRIVVRLYAFLVSNFLELLKPASFSWNSQRDAIEARSFSRMELPWSPERRRGLGLELQDVMAEELRKGLDLDDAPALIADYVENRLEEIKEQLDLIGDVARSVFGGSEYSEMDVIRFVFQSSTPSPTGVRIPTRADIARWRGWGTMIQDITDPLEAFRSLAGFESEYEPFERRVLEVAIQADHEVDRQIDEEKMRRAQGHA